MKYYKICYLIVLILFMGCSLIDSGNTIENNSENINSEGSIQNPVEIYLNKDNVIKVGVYENPSYYKIDINENNYYDSVINGISTTYVDCNFEFFSDDSFSINFDGDTDIPAMTSIEEVKLYKGRTYYLIVTNFDEFNGVSFKFNLNPHTVYPEMTNIAIDSLISNTIGNYGINVSKKYYSFTTNNANYYSVIRTYPSGKQIHEMLFKFMPDDGFSIGGRFTNTNSVYSLEGNTTYFITIHSDIAEPLDYTLKVIEGEVLF